MPNSPMTLSNVQSHTCLQLRARQWRPLRGAPALIATMADGTRYRHGNPKRSDRLLWNSANAELREDGRFFALDLMASAGMLPDEGEWQHEGAILLEIGASSCFVWRSAAPQDAIHLHQNGLTGHESLEAWDGFRERRERLGDGIDTTPDAIDAAAARKDQMMEEAQSAAWRST